MIPSSTLWAVLIVAIVAANLPWLSERRFILFPASAQQKSTRFRLLEWLLLYIIVGGIALGLERNVTGVNHEQDWPFFATTFALFIVFALPGFIYRHDWRHHPD